MRAATYCLLAVGVALHTTGCGQGPTIPSAHGAAVTATTPTPRPMAPNAVRITSGGDGLPVQGARVTIEGETYVTSESGEVTPTEHPGHAIAGRDIDVDAPGFLPRRTRVDAERLVTLWPVASDAEADAVRVMVYGHNEVLYPPDSGPFYLSFLDAGVDPTLASLWQREATAFGASFGLGYTLSFNFQYEQNEIAVTTVPAPGGASCEPTPEWGFCRTSPHYKIFRVLPERARDPLTVRRVVASWFLSRNPLPGFLNPDAPLAEPSPLEIQTIRMILQRRLPNRWPDTDR